MNYSLSDLGTAFRKAKVALYYSPNPSLFAIADYEENLVENLHRLQKRINGKSTTWVKDPDFLGTLALISGSFDLMQRTDDLRSLNTHKYTYGVKGVGLEYLEMLRSAQR
jgi:hypothetical protein